MASELTEVVRMDLMGLAIVLITVAAVCWLLLPQQPDHSRDLVRVERQRNDGEP